MKEKKSFVIYCDWENTFKKIGKYEAGDLIQGIFEYMRTGETPEFESFAVEAIFTLLVETFKRDRDKYYKMCERNANNINKRWDENNKTTYTKNTSGKNGIKQNTKNTDNDNVNENENENEKYNILTSSSPAVTDSKCSGNYSDDFLEFWSSYPKKVGKGSAYKIFSRLKLTKKEKNAILTALDWQKKSDQWVRDNGQFIPYPATYLNQRRWEDEPQSIFCGDITDPDRYKEDEEDYFDFGGAYGE